MPTHTPTCAIGYTGCPRLSLNRGDGLRFCRGRGRQSGMSIPKETGSAASRVQAEALRLSEAGETIDSIAYQLGITNGNAAALLWDNVQVEITPASPVADNYADELSADLAAERARSPDLNAIQAMLAVLDRRAAAALSQYGVWDNTALPAEEIAPAQLPCTSCQGKGRLPHTCPSGAVAYYVCPECAGSGVDGGEH